MLSQDNSISKAIQKITSIETLLKKYKEKINFYETERISDLILDLKNDEERLNICIKNIELLHRNMFVLPDANSTPINSDNESLVKDAEYSMIDSESSENESVGIMNVSEPYEDESSSIMQQPGCSTDVLDLGKGEPDCLIQQLNYSVYEPEFPMDMRDLRKDEPNLLIEQPNYSIHEQETPRERLIIKIPKSLFRRHQSNYSKHETVNIMSESSNSSDESIEYEPSKDEKEYSKQIVLNKLVDKEREISVAVLKVALEFSRFQLQLQDVTKDGSALARHLANGSNIKLKEKLEALSETVLKIDKDINKINNKYSKCLDELMNDKTKAK